MSRSGRWVEEPFRCPGCEYDWKVEGRLNADGAFEPTDYEDLDCPECGGSGYPEEIDP